MPLRVRIAAVIAATAALIATAAAPALAEPTPVKSADVVKALGLPAEPIDFVVLVDASSSMAKSKRASSARAALTELFGIMGPTDRLSLFTYASTVTAQYRGLVGDQSAALLANLPANGGTWNDEGAALEAGISELARDGASPNAAIIVITDGAPAAGPGSKYQSEEGKAWAALVDDGRLLSRQRPIASYQIGLAAAADSSMLTRVFPDTQTIAGGSSARQIRAIRDDLNRLRAGRALAAELQAPITVTWSGDFASGSTGWLPIRLSIQSPYPHVPLTLSKLSVTASGGAIAEISGLPATVSLSPGEATSLDAKIQVDGDGDLRTMGLAFQAVIDSPWRSALTSALDVPFEPQLITVSGTGSNAVLERSLPTLVTVGGLLGLSILVWWLGAALLSPRMRGELIFSRHAEEVARVTLHGRRQFLSGTAGGGALSTLAGTVYGARPIRGVEREVRVDLVAGSNWSRVVIPDGHVIQMGDIEIGYSSEPGAIVRPALVH